MPPLGEGFFTGDEPSRAGAGVHGTYGIHGRIFTGGNGENGAWFFICAIRVIRGERIRKVGRKKVQEAQKQRAEESAPQAVCHLTPCGTKLAVLVCVHELNLDH